MRDVRTRPYIDVRDDVDVQTESKFSLPRATGKAEEGSKKNNGLRSDLRALNLGEKNWGGEGPPPSSLFAFARSRTRPDQFNFASAGPAIYLSISLSPIFLRGVARRVCAYSDVAQATPTQLTSF